METQTLRPAGAARELPVEEARARHREKVRRRWLAGSTVFVALLAAAATEPLPEVALFLLAAFSLAVVVDAGFALFSRGPFTKGRIVADALGVAGAVGLSVALSAFFSTPVLALFAGTALVLGIVFLFTA